MDARATDIAVTFYNVAEMAADARRRKQFEQEANAIGKHQRSDDELAAAVGLLMMHYQLSNNNVVKSQTTPHDKPIIAASQPPLDYATKKRKSLGISPRSNKQQEPATADARSKYHTHTATKYKPSLNSGGKASLLTSCRNILKEFLSQNSVS